MDWLSCGTIAMPQRLNLYLAARWKGYATRVAGGVIVAVLLMMGAVLTTQWWWLPLGAVFILWAAWFYASTTWQIRNLLDTRRTVEGIWQLLKLDTYARFVCIEVGLRAMPLALSRRLQRGTLKIIDIYNPQLMPDLALARLRLVAQEQVVHEPSDPRALWVEGSVDRLPQRDDSVPAVVLDQVLFALKEAGDHRRLLREVYRVLQPGGRLIVVEAVKRQDNWWLGGEWFSAETIQQILTTNHFILHDDTPINPLLHAFCVLKPIPKREQLTFNF